METEMICAICGKSAGHIMAEDVKKVGKVYKIKNLQGATNNIPGYATTASTKKTEILPFCSEECKTKYLE